MTALASMPVSPSVRIPARPVPPLQNGDRLDVAEFERRWDAMPLLKRAELIDGVVYMAAALSHDFHAAPHVRLTFAVGLYLAGTPGLTAGDNGSVRLDPRNMPQPDLYVLILPTHGGQARISDDGFVVGAPEMALEVSASSASYDLHDKLEVYRRTGVREYVVWRTYDFDIDYFRLVDGRYEPMPVGEDGIYRSDVFPGLWLDGRALLAGDLAAVQRTIAAGLATPEHAAFVERLSASAAAAAAAK